MEEIVKLVLPFFSIPKNYAQVLKKLASFAFYETYFITLLLREIPLVDNLFTRIESWGPIGRLVGIIPHYDVLNLSGIVIALIIAHLTHMFQFHDRISDIFGIRRRFDRKSILVPLSERVGSVVTKDKEEKIAKNRDKLMRAVFYKYASSRADNSLVDKHDIEHALNAWSWFWVFVEGLFYFGVSAIISWWLGAHALAMNFTIVSIVLLAIASVQRSRLSSYARPQIDGIVANPNAFYDVKGQFDAL